MNDETYHYSTGPTADGLHITARPSRRDAITHQAACDWVTAQLNGAPPTPDNVLTLFAQGVVDWTVRGHPVGPIGGDLLSFYCSCGGSSPVGAPEPHTFEELEIALTCHYATAGRARAKAQFSAENRAKAQFSAEKVGETSRVVPVFSKVYHSMSRQLNHYTGGQGLTIELANRQPIFDPTHPSHYVRFRKPDGTWVTAASYAYYKGRTIIAIPPATLTGQVEMEASMEINGSIRSAIYAYPLTS